MTISEDLKWNKNTEYLVEKAYSRMELLSKAAEFTKSIEDKREIYILYIRSLQKQSDSKTHQYHRRRFPEPQNFFAA